MSQFVITDLARPADGTVDGLPRLPRLEARLALATRTAAQPDWRRQVLALAGNALAVEHDVPVGAVLAAQAGLATPPGTQWAVATPVRLAAGMDHVQLQAAPVAFPAAWVVPFNAAFADAGLALHAAGDHWLWSVAQPLAVRTHDPAPLVGHDIGPCLPTGVDGGKLRRLVTEAQMWLHGAGEQRLGGCSPAPAGSELPNAFWPWGFGVTTALAEVPLQYTGRDPWALAVCRGGDGAPRLVTWTLEEHGQAASGAGIDAFSAADAAWSAGLGAAVREAGAADLWLDGRAWQLSRADAWQPLRRLRRWRGTAPWWLA
jgi:hypothetical protein